MDKGLIIAPWFIQNQAQGGPGSASAVEDDPDGGKGVPVSEGLLDLFCSLGGYLEHRSLLAKNEFTRHGFRGGYFKLITHSLREFYFG